jgi:hypothetical protein
MHHSTSGAGQTHNQKIQLEYGHLATDQLLIEMDTDDLNDSEHEIKSFEKAAGCIYSFHENLFSEKVSLKKLSSNRFLSFQQNLYIIYQVFRL